MKKSLLSLLLVGAIAGAGQLSAQAESWEPKRINKIIELWEMGEPAYYTQITAGGYEEGLALAQTEADYITYNLEHYGVDFTQLREFMRGLVDGGPTKSGHRTPAVVVVVPAVGWTEGQMMANTWMMQNVINAGVHGILLPHAVDPGAARVMVEAIRYPFAPPAPGLRRGMQGNGSASYAANIWGISGNEYLQKADVYPLNPNGEIVLGLKIENIHGVENARELVNTPGIAFAEWGPGDQGYWLAATRGMTQPAPGNDPALDEIRSRVFSAVKEANKFFLNSCSANNVTAMIDEGVMICTGGGTEASTVGRRHTNRQMPW